MPIQTWCIQVDARAATEADIRQRPGGGSDRCWITHWRVPIEAGRQQMRQHHDPSIRQPQRATVGYGRDLG